MGAKCKGCGSCILFIMTTVIVYKLSLPVFLESFDPEGDVPSDTRYLPKAERTYNGRHIVCHKFEGGVGSLLFQYASLLGISQSQNRILVVSGDLSLEQLLKVTQFKTDKTQCRSVERITETACCRLDDKIANLDRSKNYAIEGVMHSWKYFKENLVTLRNSIRFQEAVVVKAKKVLQQALRSHNLTVTNSAVVGVHVRRGDKLHWTAVDLGYRVAPREYFLKAMKYFRDRISRSVIFLVVSDDHEWCKSNLVGLPGVILAGHHEPSVDLAMLTLMDHSIISLGAFSWWAAFLTKGEVVYYKDFVDGGSKIRQQFDSTFADYILPEWTGLA